MITRFFSRIGTNIHGQSFLELALVLVILVLMLSGVVEFGFLLNNYLKVLDGTREGARFSSDSDPYIYDTVTGDVVGDDTRFYIRTVIQAMNVMYPVILNAENNRDDIVISVFSVAGYSITRGPEFYQNGWSLCNSYKTDPFTGNELDNYYSATSDPAWVANYWDTCTVKSSNFTTSQLLARMDPEALASGVLLVEVYYNYSQILKLPVFAQVIPDPILVYTYSVMPLSAAEPKPPGPK